MTCSRFLMRNSAARRAERGPSPGRRASSWISRSISGPAMAVGICSNDRIVVSREAAYARESELS